MRKIISVLIVISTLSIALLTGCGKCDKDSHNYVEEVVEQATLNEKGKIVYTCSKCGDSYEIDSDLSSGLKIDGYSLEEVKKTLDEKEITYEIQETTSSTIPENTVVSHEITGDFSLLLKVSTGSKSELVGVEESHVNIKDTKLSVVDTTYWEDDKWEISKCEINDGKLYLYCNVNYGSQVRFILDENSNAPIGVGAEESEYDAMKASKYEDIGIAVFDENVIDYYEQYSYSVAGDSFDFIIEIPTDEITPETETLFLKYNLELLTTSYSWSMDSFYLKIKLIWE